MRTFPDLRVSDGHRTKIGDWLVNFLPVLLFKPSGGVSLFLGRCSAEARSAVLGKEIIRYDKFGIRVGRYCMQYKPWGIVRSYRMLGVYWGRVN